MPKYLQACAWLLAAIYATTAAWKLLAFDEVVLVVVKSAFVDMPFARVLVIVVCILEFCLAVALVFEIATPAAAVVSAALAAASFLLHSYVLWSGELVPCGCVGRVLKPVEGWEHHVLVLVASVMFVVSIAVYLGVPGVRRRITM